MADVVDDKLRELARQAVADADPNGAGGHRMQAVKLLREADGKRGRMQDYIAAVNWALDHRSAAGLPDNSIVARTYVVYIKSGPIWYSTNGTTHTDEDIDRYLLESRTRVLRVGAGENQTEGN